MTPEEIKASVARLEKALLTFVEKVTTSEATADQIAVLPAVASVLVRIYEIF